jgi:hypothetical protein
MVVEQESRAKAKYLRVKVVDNTKEGRPAVNVRVPIGVAKFGLKMAGMFSPDVSKADLDWDVISAAIDESATGELVHVEDDAAQKTIDIFVE